MSEADLEPLASGTPHQRVALVSCSVLESELSLLGTSCIVAQRQLPMGLHDSPDLLRAQVQAAIDQLEREAAAGALAFDVIVLVYGLCGLGTDGLHAGAHPLVIARAHDCFTHLLGSAEDYAHRQAVEPELYYYSPGWNAARRVPGPERLEQMRRELSERFDPEDVDYLLETEQALWAARNKGVFVDLGTSDAEVEAAYACRCCQGLGWKFERVRGDPELLRTLLAGPWDDRRFQVVPPGAVLRFSRDERIFKIDTGGQA